jgi:mannose-1-phosphate guanylyltransferase
LPVGLVSDDIDAKWAPVQYCGLGEPTTMLQKALHRAGRISHSARVMVTAAEVHRSHWQHVLWFIRAEHRFVIESPGWSVLTTAAAVLSIAARAPSALITMLPARSYVEDEWTLTVALHRVLSARHLLADGVVTLGFVGSQFDVDEDYLVLSPLDSRSTAAVSVTARRPMDWVTPHLVRRGALVASGIYVGYAGSLAQLLYKYWPTLTHKLLRHFARSIVPGVENHIPPNLAREALRAAPRPFWNRPPWIPLRALRVANCGLSGLHSVRAIERIDAQQPDSLPTRCTDFEYERLKHEHTN